jgi:predicted anti-sigma-YlaC factor YlaD
VKSNLTCDDCRTELVAYLDGALTVAVARVIEQHVVGCPACRAALEVRRALSARLAEVTELAPPRWLEERIVRRALGPRYLWTGWRRVGALAASLSFAGSIGLLLSLPRLLQLGPVADSAGWLTSALGHVLSSVVAAPKRIAVDVTFYQPIARQVWSSLEALGALPRVALVLLRQPEAQTALAIALFLGLAMYFVLRPSRSHERGVGHACYSL